MKSNIETVSVHIPIMMGVSNKGNCSIKPNKVYTLVLNYPFAGLEHNFPIKSGPKGLSGNDLVGVICKIYCDKVYKNDKSEEKYGVFGHDVGDLSLCEIKVNHVKKLITVCVNS